MTRIGRSSFDGGARSRAARRSIESRSPSPRPPGPPASRSSTSPPKSSGSRASPTTMSTKKRPANQPPPEVTIEAASPQMKTRQENEADTPDGSLSRRRLPKRGASHTGAKKSRGLSGLIGLLSKPAARAMSRSAPSRGRNKRPRAL